MEYEKRNGERGICMFTNDIWMLCDVNLVFKELSGHSEIL